MNEKLVQCPLFIGVTYDDIEDMFSDIEYKIMTFGKNEILANENEICNRLMIVMEGSVRGEMTDFSGKVIKIEDIEPCRPLAPAFLFGKNNRFPVTISANTTVKVLSISRDMVLKLFQNNVHFLTNYLNMISNRAQFLSNKIKFLSFQTIKGKLAHYLLQLDKARESKPFMLPASQQEMADLFGVTRPALGRAIREMDSDGLIEATGKNVKILNYNRLEDVLR